MAIPKSSIKRRGKAFCFRYSENGQRKRVSLGTDSFQEAKELQRQFDSARARGLHFRTPGIRRLLSQFE